jgi:hypothetical protein
VKQHKPIPMWNYVKMKNNQTSYNLFKNKSGQVWVETTVYTLIGLTIIAILLAIITPQIDKVKDRTIIENTLTALEKINSELLDASQTTGNVRIVDLRLAKGTLQISPENNAFIYSLENTRLELSEPGEELKEGNLILKTLKTGSRFKIILSLPYENINLTFNQLGANKTLQQGTTPYKLKIENMGEINSKTNIDLNII